MAEVFISYARADRDRIERLAATLEAEGYSVWWDRHIDAGAEFSADIERELEAAKAVVVCWSDEGSKSRWVKDEANVAATAGKLVSVDLDAGLPPIGFRQFHTVSLNGWNGKMDAPAFQELARSIRSKINAENLNATDEAPATSTTASGKARAAPGLSLFDLHKTHPKIFAGSVASLIVVIAIAFFMSGGEDDDASSASEIAAAQGIDLSKSIAVLPFDDFSADDHEWFADGLTEEILNSLTRAPDLLVASRTSSFTYKDSDEAAPAIAERLGVEHILEGSVRRAEGRLRVTAQLIRASDGFHLWSQNYDRSPDDAIAIQEEIATEIAKALKTAMDPQALAEMAEMGTDSIEAYEAFLQAINAIRNFSRRRAGGTMDDARALIEQARALDPNFSVAHATAARFYLIALSPTRIGSGNDLTDLETLLAAYLERIEAAIETAPRDADRELYRAARARIFMQQRESLEISERIAEAYPLDIAAWQDLLDDRINFGDFEGAQTALARLRPLIENSPRDYGPFVARSVWARDFEGAANYAREALNKSPNNGLLLYQAHRAFLWAGKHDEARALLPLIETGRMPPSTKTSALMRQACADGDRVAAIALSENFSDNDISGQWYANLLLGDKERATAILAPLDRTAAPYPLASFLSYGHFDRTQYPNLNKLLTEQGYAPPAMLDIPFACPPEHAE